MCGCGNHAQTAHTVILQAVSVLVIDARAIGVVLIKKLSPSFSLGLFLLTTNIYVVYLTCLDNI